MNKKEQQVLQTKINEFKSSTKKDNPTKPLGAISNIAIELVAGIIVGVMIGMFFDNLFASRPIFLIISLILAMIATFRSIWNKYIEHNGT